jgi:hypothetical protein
LQDADYNISKTGAFKIVAVYYYTIVLIKSFHKSPAKGDNMVEKIANNFHQSSDRSDILPDEEK